MGGKQFSCLHFFRHTVNWHNLQHGSSSDIDVKPDCPCLPPQAGDIVDIMCCVQLQACVSGWSDTHTHTQEHTEAEQAQ